MIFGCLALGRKVITGNGDIASVLPERDDLHFFASGVSNSQETRESEYEREIELLSLQDMGEHLVYFSTLALFYGNSRYVDHKWQMEALTKAWFPKHTIIRLGNITFGKNLNTIINSFKLILSIG